MLVSTGFSATVSPRISFSHDLNQIDVLPIEKQQHYTTHHPLDLDFDFGVSKCLELDKPSISTADELFFNGKILPLEIKKKVDLLSPPIVSSTENEKKVSLKEMLAKKDEQYHHPSSKPFWQYTRSSSLNCDNAKSRSLIRSLSFLSRSNSTGSAPKFERSLLPKNSQKKQHLQKQTSTAKSDKERSNVPWSRMHNAYNSSQKPPLKKNKKSDHHNSYYGNGIRISSVLNLPPHYISIRTSLFGFGSLFCNGKDKKKKK